MSTNNMPAFPATEQHGLNSGDPGMTLRDYFAGKVLQAFLTCESLIEKSNDAVKSGRYRSEWVAEQAYRFADAMIKVRSEDKGETL